MSAACAHTPEAFLDSMRSATAESALAKVGKTFKVLIDRKEGDHFIGRTEFDSPEVDNEVLIDAKESYLRIGDFTIVKITSAEDYDLFGVVKD